MNNLFLGKITGVRCNLPFFSMYRNDCLVLKQLSWACKDLDNYRFFRFELNGGEKMSLHGGLLSNPPLLLNICQSESPFVGTL